jgi:hypothetical protein
LQPDVGKRGNYEKKKKEKGEMMSGKGEINRHFSTSDDSSTAGLLANPGILLDTKLFFI